MPQAEEADASGLGVAAWAVTGQVRRAERWPFTGEKTLSIKTRRRRSFA
jgi:hypothetical protein